MSKLLNFQLAEFKRISADLDELKLNFTRLINAEVVADLDEFQSQYSIFSTILFQIVAPQILHTWSHSVLLLLLAKIKPFLILITRNPTIVPPQTEYAVQNSRESILNYISTITVSSYRDIILKCDFLEIFDLSKPLEAERLDSLCKQILSFPDNFSLVLHISEYVLRRNISVGTRYLLKSQPKALIQIVEKLIDENADIDPLLIAYIFREHTGVDTLEYSNESRVFSKFVARFPNYIPNLLVELLQFCEYWKDVIGVCDPRNRKLARVCGLFHRNSDVRRYCAEELRLLSEFTECDPENIWVFKKNFFANSDNRAVLDGPSKYDHDLFLKGEMSWNHRLLYLRKLASVPSLILHTPKYFTALLQILLHLTVSDLSAQEIEEKEYIAAIIRFYSEKEIESRVWLREYFGLWNWKKFVKSDMRGIDKESSERFDSLVHVGCLNSDILRFNICRIIFSLLFSNDYSIENQDMLQNLLNEPGIIISEGLQNSFFVYGIVRQTPGEFDKDWLQFMVNTLKYVRSTPTIIPSNLSHFQASILEQLQLFRKATSFSEFQDAFEQLQTLVITEQDFSSIWNDELILELVNVLKKYLLTLPVTSDDRLVYYSLLKLSSIIFERFHARAVSNHAQKKLLSIISMILNSTILENFNTIFDSNSNYISNPRADENDDPVVIFLRFIHSCMKALLTNTTKEPPNSVIRVYDKLLTFFNLHISTPMYEERNDTQLQGAFEIITLLHQKCGIECDNVLEMSIKYLRMVSDLKPVLRLLLTLSLRISEWNLKLWGVILPEIVALSQDSNVEYANIGVCILANLVCVENFSDDVRMNTSKELLFDILDNQSQTIEVKMEVIRFFCNSLLNGEDDTLLKQLHERKVIEKLFEPESQPGVQCELILLLVTIFGDFITRDITNVEFFDTAFQNLPWRVLMRYVAYRVPLDITRDEIVEFRLAKKAGYNKDVIRIIRNLGILMKLKSNVARKVLCGIIMEGYLPAFIDVEFDDDDSVLEHIRLFTDLIHVLVEHGSPEILHIVNESITDITLLVKRYLVSSGAGIKMQCVDFMLAVYCYCKVYKKGRKTVEEFMVKKQEADDTRTPGCLFAENALSVGGLEKCSVVFCWLILNWSVREEIVQWGYVEILVEKISCVMRNISNLTEDDISELSVQFQFLRQLLVGNENSKTIAIQHNIHFQIHRIIEKNPKSTSSLYRKLLITSLECLANLFSPKTTNLLLTSRVSAGRVAPNIFKHKNLPDNYDSTLYKDLKPFGMFLVEHCMKSFEITDFPEIVNDLWKLVVGSEEGKFYVLRDKAHQQIISNLYLARKSQSQKKLRIWSESLLYVTQHPQISSEILKSDETISLLLSLIRPESNLNATLFAILYNLVTLKKGKILLTFEKNADHLKGILAWEIDKLKQYREEGKTEVSNGKAIMLEMEIFVGMLWMIAFDCEKSKGSMKSDAMYEFVKSLDSEINNFPGILERKLTDSIKHNLNGLLNLWRL